MAKQGFALGLGVIFSLSFLSSFWREQARSARCSSTYCVCVSRGFWFCANRLKPNAFGEVPEVETVGKNTLIKSEKDILDQVIG